MANKTSRGGGRYFDEQLLEWCDRMHAPHDGALQRAFDAPDANEMPSIQVGVSEGRFLELVLRLVGARRVVEIGTLAGYSAIRIARVLPADGRLWTLEHDPKHAAVARANIATAGLDDRVEVLEGAALDRLPSLEPHGPFDAVFIDADKGNYDRYGIWAEANLRGGGLLLGDNSFFFGRLLEDSDEAAAMRRFHERAAAAFDSVNIPTPDGLLLGIKR